MKRMSSRNAFTIVELLVVVSIIALLVGILVPAIGKARDQALLTRSENNLSQLGKAQAIYSSEYNDRQVTFINDNFASYGANGAAAVSGFAAQNGIEHPGMILGYGRGSSGQFGIWGYWFPPNPVGSAGNWQVIVPIDFASKWGAFRYTNVRAFNTYVNGRFYDPTFYAPKDSAVMASTEPLFDHADEFFNAEPDFRPSSYVFSPAAMFSPDVLGLNQQSGLYYTNPFSLKAGYRSPAMGQAVYGNLKTHIMEHHWLQNRKKECNPALAPGSYDGCEPYYFNAAVTSSPRALFFDGHIGAAGVNDAMEATKRMVVQSGQPNHGLWSKNIPGWNGSYEYWGTGGYFSSVAYDSASTSFHIATIDGIKGRDFVGK